MNRRPSEVVAVSFRPRTLLSLVVALLAGAAVVALVRAAPWMLAQISIGILLALALDPVIGALRSRWDWSRARAVGALATVLVAVAAAMVLLLGPAAVRQAGDVAQQLPDTVRQAYDLPVIGHLLERRDAAKDVDRWFQQLPDALDAETVSRLVDVVLGGVRALLVIVLVAVSVMLDGDGLVARARRLLPPRLRPRATRLGRIASTSIGRYFAGSLLVAVLNGVMTLTVGLVLDVPLITLAAVWAVLTNLIPQIGGFLGGSVLVGLALAKGPLPAVVALGVFLAYQQLENNVIAPAIVGRALGLSPLTTMVAALVGGAAAGIPGALIATPLVGTVKAIALDRADRTSTDMRHPG